MRNLRSVYEWHKEQLWLQLIIIAVCALFLNFYELHPVFHSAIYLISVTKIILSLKLMNVNPASVNDQENFSWKYYQSLPLSKKDLYHLFIINHLFNFIPAVFWFLCFHRDLAQMFETSPWALLRWVPLMLLGLFAFGLQNFVALVVYPRMQFSRINKRSLLYQNLRNGLYYVAGLAHVFLGIAFLRELALLKFPSFIIFYEHISPYVWNKYFGFGLAVLAVIQIYQHNFRVWMEEKRRTPRSNWKAVRDIPVMIAVVGLMVYPFTSLTTSNDGGPRLHEAVIENKISELKRLLRGGANINEQNENGFTPLMTAAYRGRTDMFNLLLDAGAKQDKKFFPTNKHFRPQGDDLYLLALKGGSLSIVKKLFTPEKANYLFTDDASPLHQVSTFCHEDVVDFLIDQGAKVNVTNKVGKTPLHKASEKSCFPAVASLLEAGADPLIKDKVNKLAYEYGRKGARSPAAYLERKTLKRLPQK